MQPGYSISYYELAEKLGENTTGGVYKALGLDLKRPVARKFLRASLCDTEEQVGRFEHEASVVEILNHANIPAIREISHLEGLPFEYLSGGMLKSALDQLRAARQQISPDYYAIRLANGLVCGYRRA
jgi:serine/threonine-protein kinase